MILVLMVGIGVGVFFGAISDSVIIGLVTGFMATGFLASAWNEAGAVISQATQPQRDRAILEELKKMNKEGE